VKYKVKKSKITKYGIAVSFLIGMKVIDAFSLVYAKAGNRNARSKSSTPSTHRLKENKTESGKRISLKVMTLNMAHGRKNGRHQLLLKKSTIKSNLNDISSVLRQKKPDLVALQEADGPSAWSGNFDHVQFIAKRAQYTYSVLGEHVKGKRNTYGTALLAMLSLNTPVSIQFAPSPPTFSKGIVVSTINLPGYPDIEVDVASVHLDFSRKSVREKQAKEITSKLGHRKRPLIMMGDFNCEWTAKESTLRVLAKELNLKAYQPYAANMKTYPKSGRRLDWILISPEFEFITYDILKDTVSDHLGIVSELKVVSGG